LKFLTANFRSARGEIDLIFATMTVSHSSRSRRARPRIGRVRRRR
jgi:Holliday junction resolvase-like predicted endonuclease